MSAPDPVVRGYLERRMVETPTGTIISHRPRLILSPLTRYPIPEGNSTHRFILDTGSDVSMVPISVARRFGFIGFDESAAWVATRTSFQGELNGRWGTLQFRLPASPRTVPCFYYDPNASGRARWWERWVRRSTRPAEDPLLLGCAGVLGGDLRLTIDGNREVGLYPRD